MHAICLASGGVRGKGGVDGIRYIHHGGSLSRCHRWLITKYVAQEKKWGEINLNFKYPPPTPQSHVT